MSEPVSAGEVGGIIAGGIAILAALGKGVQWLLGWFDKREVSRTVKLQKWHDELEAREQDLNSRIDGRLSSLEKRDEQRAAENLALRMVLAQVTGALKVKDPENPALKRAEQLLTASFPIDPMMPADFNAALTTIETNDKGATARGRATKAGESA